jgi:hypothetical protein
LRALRSRPRRTLTPQTQTGWSKADLKATKWSKKENATMAACFLKHGNPSHDNEWAVFYKFFPEKPRRGVRSKLDAMKEDASLGNPATLEGITEIELMKMGLNVVKKEEKKKKAIELKDLL